jgi:hypothetical protein
MRRFLFNLINIVLFPVTLAGYVFWVGKGSLQQEEGGPDRDRPLCDSA